MLIACSCLCKILNFIQLFKKNSLNGHAVTKLCHIKHGHLENFYISLETQNKLWYRCNGMTDLHKIWHVDVEHVSKVYGC